MLTLLFECILRNTTRETHGMTRAIDAWLSKFVIISMLATLGKMIGSVGGMIKNIRYSTLLLLAPDPPDQAFYCVLRIVFNCAVPVN